LLQVLALFYKKPFAVNSVSFMFRPPDAQRGIRISERSSPLFSLDLYSSLETQMVAFKTGDTLLWSNFQKILPVNSPSFLYLFGGIVPITLMQNPPAGPPSVPL